MTASPETRAIRRYNELKSKGDEVAYDDVLKNVQERDYIDTTREDSPLLKAEDAIEIDNSNMTLEEQFEKILNLVKSVLNDK
jgi:cytidylate kinase